MNMVDNMAGVGKNYGMQQKLQELFERGSSKSIQKKSLIIIYDTDSLSLIISQL